MEDGDADEDVLDFLIAQSVAAGVQHPIHPSNKFEHELDDTGCLCLRTQPPKYHMETARNWVVSHVYSSLIFEFVKQ